MNNERDNSLQQCLINKHGEHSFVVIFLALLQPQTVIAKKLFTCSQQPLAIHLAWLFKSWINLSIIG